VKIMLHEPRTHVVSELYPEVGPRKHGIRWSEYDSKVERCTHGAYKGCRNFIISLKNVRLLRMTVPMNELLSKVYSCHNYCRKHLLSDP